MITGGAPIRSSRNGNAIAYPAGSLAVIGSAPGVCVSEAVHEDVESFSLQTVKVAPLIDHLLRRKRNACRGVRTVVEPLSVPVDISRSSKASAFWTAVGIAPERTIPNCPMTLA